MSDQDNSAEIESEFTFDKETTNTVRFSEVVGGIDDTEAFNGTIYVRKDALPADPDDVRGIRVQAEVVADAEDEDSDE